MHKGVCGLVCQSGLWANEAAPYMYTYSLANGANGANRGQAREHLYTRHARLMKRREAAGKVPAKPFDLLRNERAPLDEPLERSQQLAIVFGSANKRNVSQIRKSLRQSCVSVHLLQRASQPASQPEVAQRERERERMKNGALDLAIFDARRAEFHGSESRAAKSKRAKTTTTTAKTVSKLLA